MLSSNTGNTKSYTNVKLEKATNFIPRQGEIIVYDVDATHTYERFKIGDGVTNVYTPAQYAPNWSKQ